MSGRYAVIGDPVAHSLSPSLFAWLAREAQWDGQYEARRVATPELAELVTSIRRGDLQGVSVTVPHKEAIVPLLDELSVLAKRVGAVNCVTRESSGRLWGHNTDVSGFVSALGAKGITLPGKRVLLLGAGGAARAAAFGCADALARELIVANRQRGRAEALAQGVSDARSALATRVTGLTVEGLEEVADQVDLIVNATSVGLSDPSVSPWPAGLGLPRGVPVMDMVYRPLETALLSAARAGGGVCVDGLWMLIFQALEQRRLWTGYEGEAGLAERLHRHLAKESA